MATTLATVNWTFACACEYFTEEILPIIQEQYEQDGVPDYPARCEAWCNWTDMLCKDGEWLYLYEIIPLINTHAEKLELPNFDDPEFEHHGFICDGCGMDPLKG